MTPTAQTYLRRRDRLREICREKKVDAYLTFDFSDVFYLTGFPSEGCFILVSRAGDFVFSPLLLVDHLRASVGKVPGLTVVFQTPLLKSLGQIVRRQRFKKIGFDDSKLTVGLLKALEQDSAVKWTALPELVLRQRMIKDAAEIELISRACHITYTSSQECFRALREGQTEEETARFLERRFNHHGSPKVAFETIVAFQENAAFPHHVVTGKKLKKNSVVLTDLGCQVGGYKSDLTRTTYFGKITPKFRKIYEIVHRSQQEGVHAVRAGVTAGEVDFVCREVIRKAGYGAYFIHGTGHGVGIDIHEPPRLGIGSKEMLREGMIVTVEPGIYLPGEFGVRIEDTLLVKKNGSETLTK
jgi:Xaa-Pro aminopeptidase